MIREGILLFPNQPDEAVTYRTRVAGLRLLERGIRTMAKAGIDKVLVVMPPAAKLNLTAFTRKLPLELRFVSWGSSPAPEELPAGDFLVLLGDYVHHHSSLTDLMNRELGDLNAIVQVSDPQQQGVNMVVEAGPRLAFRATETPDGPVCTGTFLCAANLFSAQEMADDQLDFWTLLADKAETGHTQHAFAQPLWRRVRDRRDARAVKNMLFGQVTKKTSGFVSRHLNARLSIPTSKILVETGLSPHMITMLLVMPTGLGAAYLMLSPNEYPKLALSGILWHLAAVFDRCDGEVARVKLCESKFGAWFDTVTDNIAYVCASLCFLVGFSKVHPEPVYMIIGLSCIGMLLVFLVVMYISAWRSGSGSLQHFMTNFTRQVAEADRGLIYRILQRGTFMGKRDFFSFFYFLTAVADGIEVFFLFAALLYIVQLIGAVSFYRRMHRAAH